MNTKEKPGKVGRIHFPLVASYLKVISAPSGNAAGVTIGGKDASDGGGGETTVFSEDEVATFFFEDDLDEPTSDEEGFDEEADLDVDTGFEDVDGFEEEDGAERRRISEQPAS